jgi:hypothetical protein
MARAPNLSGNPPKTLDGGRTRLRAQWRELFKAFGAVICAVKPTPAYQHDHSPEQESAASMARSMSIPTQLAWPGITTLPGLPSTAISDRLRAGRTAGWRADRRALAGGSHAAEAGRTDRARVRRLRSTARVQGLIDRVTVTGSVIPGREPLRASPATVLVVKCFSRLAPSFGWL